MLPMIPALRRPAPAALLLAFVLAFAPDVRAQTAPAGDALAKLVPEGTAVYVQAPSLERLGNAMRKIIAAFDKEKAQTFDIDAMLEEGELPLSPKNIDHQKPLAFCLVLPATQGGQPAPVFLLPATSPDALVKDIAATGMPFQTSVSGSYVTVSMSPGAKPGTTTAAIANGMPAGEISARIDLKRLVAHFRPMIDMGLSQMQMAMAAASQQAAGGMDVAPILKLYGEGLKEIVDSGEGLDLALRLDGTKCEIASTLTAQEKSALADLGSKDKTDVKAMARYLEAGSSMGFAVGMDPATFTKRFKSLIDASLAVYPEPMRSDLQKAMVSLPELCAVMGNSMGASGRFSADGLRYSIYMRPKDPKKLVETYKTMLKAMPSMSVGEPKEETIDGIAVTRMHLKIDAKAFADAMAKKTPPKPGQANGAEEAQKMLEKLYGKDGIEFVVGTKGDVTAVILGGDDAYRKAGLARISSPGTVPPGIAHGLEQVGELNPCFVLQYDIGKTMHEMQGLMTDTLPGGVTFPDLPASITSWIGIDGRTFKGAMSVDLSELGAFATAMKNAEDAKSPAPPKK